MSDWKLSNGEPADGATLVRQPNHAKGIAKAVVVGACSRCSGRGFIRSSHPQPQCPRCRGTGSRTQHRYLFTAASLQRFDARLARMRAHHQFRMADERVERARVFEERFAETLACLRELGGAYPFSMFLDDAVREQYISESRLNEIEEARRQHEQRVREREQARERQETAEQMARDYIADSSFVGTAGQRTTIEATVERVANRIGGRFTMRLRDPAGNILIYSGSARNLANLQQGTRIRLEARVKHHMGSGRIVLRFDIDGNHHNVRTAAIVTIIERPTQVSVISGQQE